MKLLKRVNRLIGTLGLKGRDERPLDIHLTQEDVERELHYPQQAPEAQDQTLRVAFMELAGER